MPGKVIGQNLDYGFPGTYSRNADCIVINRRGVKTIEFGAPVVMKEDNTVTAFTEDHTYSDFIGVSCREVKQQTDYLSNDVKYLDGDPVDVLTRGSIVVRITYGTPKANTPVYIRTAENSAEPKSPVGSFLAEEDSGCSIRLRNAVFTTGKVDSNGIAEITILTRYA